MSSIIWRWSAVVLCLGFFIGCSGDSSDNGASDPVDAGTDATDLDGSIDDTGMSDGGEDSGEPAEVCDDGIDNDGDQQVDCRDADCDGTNRCAFSKIAAARSHVCGVLQSGDVFCWGRNDDGEIGNGETAAEEVPPTHVEGLDKIIDVEVGLAHVCALRSGGTVYCWGNNEDGQLGDDSFVSSPVPVQVVNLTDVADIASGGNHNCAVRNARGGGEVLCWGANDRYQLGAGGSGIRTPVQVMAPGGGNLTGYAEVTSGIEHNCALKPTGSSGNGHLASCWGDNRSGQLGTNRSEISRAGTAQRVLEKMSGAEIGDFIPGGLSAGQNSTCGIRTDGSVWCWGDGSAGHFGSQDLASIQQGAVEYQGLGDAERLWHELFHVCAQRSSGRVVCWGDNAQTSFTDDSGVYFNPVLLHDLTEPRDVAPGDLFTCWADDLGRAFCQGTADSGQLGSSLSESSTSEPQRVVPTWQ